MSISRQRRSSYEDMKKKRANIVSKHEDTIFDAFSSLRLHGACLKNQRDIVERLVEEEDEDVNRRVPKDFTIARRRLTTPLIISSRAGHTEIVKYLLKRGALVNAVSGNGASALYIACQEGQTDCVEHLIKGGADLNQREKTRGAPPIFAAAQFNFVECVKLLKQAGCDTSLKTKTNSTAIVIAAQEGYHKIVEILLPASFTQLYKSAYLCASHGYADILNTLMGPKGLRQHSKTQKVLFLSKCLEAAVKAQSPPCIRILTSQNVDLDPKKLDDAVHFAATEGYVECMRALIDAGASRKIAKKAAKQAANEKCLAALPKKGFIKGGASKLKKWFRKRATSTNNNNDDDAKRRDDGLVVTAPSPPASPAHRYRSPPTSPKVRRASYASRMRKQGSPTSTMKRSRAPTPIAVTIPAKTTNSPLSRNNNRKTPMSPSLGDLLDLKDEVGLAGSRNRTPASPVSPSIRRASMASAKSKMKKNKSFKDFDPFADLFPSGHNDSETRDPFSSTSPVRRPPVSPRVRRASAASKGRKSFKDLVVSTEKKDSSDDYDPFADLFPTEKKKMTTPSGAVSPRVRRASMNALSRRQKENEDDDDDEMFEMADSHGVAGPSPRTRTRNEYYRARQNYKAKKRSFYRSKNQVDENEKKKLEREALDAKSALDNAFRRMSLHNIENKDANDDFDMDGVW